MSKEYARSSAKLMTNGDKIVLKTLAGARALCPLNKWVVYIWWWNDVPLACFMLGSSDHNTENLTANNSCATYLEKYYVPSTLKNTALVFDRSSNYCAPPQEDKLSDPRYSI